MASNWAFAHGGANWNFPSSTVVVNINFIAAAGELLIVTYTCGSAGGTPTGATITDTGANAGWQQFVNGIQGPSGAFTFSWWRLSTPADVGGGIIVSCSGTGTFTANGSSITSGSWSVAAGFAIAGMDLLATDAVVSSVTTASFSPSVGSIRPADSDELAYLSLTATFTGSDSSTFAGTSPSTAMNQRQEANNGAFNLTAMSSLEGVQASATAGTNVFSATWGLSAPANLVGATFFYESSGQQVMIV